MCLHEIANLGSYSGPLFWEQEEIYHPHNDYNAALAAIASVYLSMHKISHSKAGEMPDFTAGVCLVYVGLGIISKSSRANNERLQ